MTRIERDGRRLRGPAVAVAVAASMLAWALHGANAYRIEQRDARATAEQARAEAQKGLRQGPDERSVYRRYAHRLRAMQRRGWIAGAADPDWPRLMASLGRESGVSRLRYERGRTRTRGVDAGAASPFALEVAPMSLTMAVAHEGVAVRALQRLARAGPGLMGLERCRLRRLRPAEELSHDASSANLALRCELQWYRARPDKPVGDGA
jgi:hypothetical protein